MDLRKQELRPWDIMASPQLQAPLGVQRLESRVYFIQQSSSYTPPSYREGDWVRQAGPLVSLDTERL